MTIVPFLNKVNDLVLNPLILLAFSISFVLFVYNAIRFLSVDPGDKGSTREEAKKSMLWGLVGMIIMFSVYGLIGFVIDTFGISSSDISAEATQFIKP